jgi:hypothetical protein
MEFLDFFVGLFNAVLAFLNAILSFLEWLLTPITSLIERWNNLFGESGE